MFLYCYFILTCLFSLKTFYYPNKTLLCQWMWITQVVCTRHVHTSHCCEAVTHVCNARTLSTCCHTCSSSQMHFSSSHSPHDDSTPTPSPASVTVTSAQRYVSTTPTCPCPETTRNITVRSGDTYSTTHMFLIASLNSTPQRIRESDHLIYLTYLKIPRCVTILTDI